MSMLPELKTSSKQCKECGEDKPLDDFYVHKNTKDRLQSICKECQKTRVAKDREDYPAKSIYRNMVNRSRAKGFEEPEWTVEEIEVTMNGCCEVTGIPFDVDYTNTEKHSKGAFRCSPDRLDNSKGYTKENTRWVVWIFNTMRADFKDEDIKIFIENLCKNEIDI
jgi:hypothetical protein